MIQWALSQGWKNSSIFTNQSMWHTTLISLKIKTIWLDNHMVLDNLNLNFFIHYKYFHCWCPKTMKNHPRWQGLWLGCCKYNVKGCCSVTQLCQTLWDPLNEAPQASLSFTISWSLLKLISIELMMPSNHLILCRPILLLPHSPQNQGLCQ